MRAIARQRSEAYERNANKDYADAHPLAPVQSLAQKNPRQQHSDGAKERGQHTDHRDIACREANRICHIGRGIE